jgi:vacuolar-type H+-ATPase catalytic subunit A/Vma1
LVPPRLKGKITFVAAEGMYNIGETVVELDFEGKNHKI